MRLESEIYLDRAPLDRRKTIREGVDVIARAHLFETRPLTVNIRDLTSAGFMMEAPVNMDIDTCLYLQLPGLSMIGARVVWASSQYTGCEFTAPLSSAELSCVEDSAWRL